MFTFRHSLTVTLSACAVAMPLFGSVAAQQGGGASYRISHDVSYMHRKSSPSSFAKTPQETGNLIATLKGAANYKTLVQLLDLAGLTKTLEGSAQFTVLAPTDAAFAELSTEKLNALKADTAELKKVLLYHVINSSISANQVLKLKTARTLQGPRVEFMMKDGQLTVNNAAVVQPDIKASNGVIHGINKVLLK
jgi:uncharacterized surface protein with fasciclin (FAS1) repeats